MQAVRTTLKWIAIGAAFFVVVGLLTMTGDKPADDPAMTPKASAASP